MIVSIDGSPGANEMFVSKKRIVAANTHLQWPKFQWSVIRRIIRAEETK